MLTQKLYIEDISGSLDEYFIQSTGLYQKLYNNLELTQDKEFTKECLAQFPLYDKSMYDMSVSDAETHWEQHQTEMRKKKEQMAEIAEWLDEDGFNTKWEKKKKYNLINKLSVLKRTEGRDITFGGKARLREITKYKQQLQFNKELAKKEKEEKQKLLDKVLAEYHLHRKAGIYLVGRACEEGNRKIAFDLTNGKIIFKPDSKTKIEISFSFKKKTKALLYKLDKAAHENALPITVRINPNSIDLAYDNEALNGYAFNKKEYKKAILLVDKSNESKRKEIAKKFLKEQEQKRLIGKIPFRYMAVDLNPHEIGFVIADRVGASPLGEFKTIRKGCIDLKRLNAKTGKASSDKLTLHRNNKKKYELAEAWLYLFELATHHQVAFFGVEELKFKEKKNSTATKEFNRQTRNVWHRALTMRLITKYCQNLGIIKIGVSPQYSSFVGNMVYNEYDPIAAATEICRRAMVKYIKGGFMYPPLERINQEKLVYLLGENVSVVGTSWVKLYKKIASAGKRYRNKSKSNLSDKNLSSYKSKVKVLSCI